MPHGPATASRAYGSPSRYVQGPHEMERLYKYVRVYAKKALIIIDPFFFEEYSKKFKEQFAANDMECDCVLFGGDCTEPEIAKWREYAQGKGFGAVIGLGGGKTCDTARVVGFEEHMARLVCPTQVATDAPTSSHSIVDRPDRTHYLWRQATNPEFVIVDTAIVVNAPVRTLISGMGDALATYIETRAVLDCHNMCHIGTGVLDHDFACTRAGVAISRESFDIIMEKGRRAVLAAQNHIDTDDFEDIVEANTLLSGLGFENTACSVAHAVETMFRTLPDTGKMLHGEMVAYGALVELILEDRPYEEFEMVYDFCKDVGLPRRLADMGITEDVDAKVDKCIEYGLQPGGIMHNEPFVVTRDKLVAAIKWLETIHE